MTSPPISFLSPTHRYAAAALFAVSLHQAQVHQTRPLGFFPPSSAGTDDPCRGDYDDDESDPLYDQRFSSSSSSSDSVSDDPDLWVHSNSGLLRPVFQFLAIDKAAWLGLEETAGSSPAKHHVGAFLRLLSEDGDDNSTEKLDQQLALSKAVDSMVLSMEEKPVSSQSKKKKLREYEFECRQKCSTGDAPLNVEAESVDLAGSSSPSASFLNTQTSSSQSVCEHVVEPLEEGKELSYQRKVTILYELLSACLADVHDEKKTGSRQRKGYDARHRVTLRLLATWLDLTWIKMEAVEIMVACSAMAVAREIENKAEEEQPPKSKWSKWKRGGIIGAAAVTGGALMAITGGLAAPAIAAGLSALAPTLGTLIPVIGASGFAAAASAAGTVAGSVAVAASFGAAGAGLTGTKMARRTGNVDEFEFKAIGNTQNQGKLAVEILISGFVFDEEDFLKPWEGRDDNLERYALQWESKNLIAMSTAIQDWLTSSISMELMKQGAMMTVLSTLVTALAWPATLLAATNFIDSKWSIALDRSDKAGKLLAEVLRKGLQGNRPVTLIGYSLGARVIFKCLQYLAGTEHSAELVERVVLLGAPISIKDENWKAARKMVAGRFVNAYSTNDWILGLAFRASMFTQGLAGIQAVHFPGIENVDVTDLIEGHSSYLWATQEIVDRLELDNYFPSFRTSKSKGIPIRATEERV